MDAKKELRRHIPIYTTMRMTNGLPLKENSSRPKWGHGQTARVMCLAPFLGQEFETGSASHKGHVLFICIITSAANTT